MPKNLTSRQLKTVKALATCGEISQAAQAAGVSRDTLYRWLRNPVFQAAMDEAIRSALGDLSRSLVALGHKAVSTMDAAMSDDQASPGAKVRVADVVLSRLLQLRELFDLEERVSQLEELQK
jgi:hypothetical protein